jgi:hypothetical protein
LANASADSKWNKERACGAGHSVQQSPAVPTGRSDVEQDDFIGAVASVGGGTLRRVTGSSQVLKLHALYDAATVHVEAGNDALGKH